ncbi:TetR/AcrR family transcriptional regulator [Wenzhouxiangella sp. AB-CW3]|uniref:TetR/AcrR family transcriptional regulator n=1 Tax=Wenzhouxiangella sp. AB-CW3 TaxID=2771012 RepID=UPI00168B5D8F|nr:TetR/AcrR family transcriptional regulator [Wenzhouxiangella sp. AB-CW3]QOC21517.1 TetR/AcrR family transcriptional regulator [Wenzhouxiangella sp. AB-CW3]
MVQTTQGGSEAVTAAKDAGSGRQRLLTAAAEEFSEHGYAGASIAAIAARAGVGKSTIFHHFESKDALYLAVIEAAAGEFARTLDQVLDGTRDVHDSLAEFQLAHLQHMFRNGKVAALVLRELRGEGPGKVAGQVRDVVAGNFQRLVNYLAAVRELGGIRQDVEPRVAALTMLSVNAFAFQFREVLRDFPGLDVEQAPDRFAAAVTDLVFRGLKVIPEAKGDKE